MSDDYIRIYYDDKIQSQRFHPEEVHVQINPSSGAYRVTLAGRPYQDSVFITRGRAVLTGDQFMDVDLTHPGLPTDAVVDCLVAHELVG